MKQMTCKDLGGPCEAMIKGNTAQEMSDNCDKHMAGAHPDVAAKSGEDKAKHLADFTPKFDAAATM